MREGLPPHTRQDIKPDSVTNDEPTNTLYYDTYRNCAGHRTGCDRDFKCFFLGFFFAPRCHNPDGCDNPGRGAIIQLNVLFLVVFAHLGAITPMGAILNTTTADTGPQLPPALLQMNGVVNAHLQTAKRCVGALETRLGEIRHNIHFNMPTNAAEYRSVRSVHTQPLQHTPPLVASCQRVCVEPIAPRCRNDDLPYLNACVGAIMIRDGLIFHRSQLPGRNIRYGTTVRGASPQHSILNFCLGYRTGCDNPGGGAKIQLNIFFSCFFSHPGAITPRGAKTPRGAMTRTITVHTT